MLEHLPRRWILATASALVALAGCEATPPGYSLPPDEIPEHPGDPGQPLESAIWCNGVPQCDATAAVDAAGPALVVTDPEVLARFPLERVLQKILDLEGHVSPPLTMAQHLFDTMNTTEGGRFGQVIHCDSSDNAATLFGKGAAQICPRIEGQLAHSETLLTPGDPDFFYPVAIVNRFDLTPVDATRCGQYRIVFAKHSGLTNPEDRVFLIFEAALSSPSPGCLESCLPVAQFWQGLQGRPSGELADLLDHFFFEGIGDYGPTISPLSYGLGGTDEGYGASEGGQIRVSMHMEDPWDMRELRVNGDGWFDPTTVKNNPSPAYFDPQSPEGANMGDAFRELFVADQVDALAGSQLTSVHMAITGEFNASESTLAGKSTNDYLNASLGSGDTTFLAAIQAKINEHALNADCPDDDPLDAAAILRRASSQSCGGCHAPNDLVGPERSLGCGLVWPESIGQAHITEKSEISPALKEVFLPHRAQVLETYLTSCDAGAITGTLQSSSPGGQVKKITGQAGPGATPGNPLRAVRTIGGSQSH